MSLPTIAITDGTLTADPELKFVGNDSKAVVSVNIACNSRRKNPQTGQWEDGDTTFIRGQVWGKPAENIAESLAKGDRVNAAGSLKQRSYEKDGQTRTVYEAALDWISPSLLFATATPQKAGGGSKPAASTGGWDDADPDWG